MGNSDMTVDRLVVGDGSTDNSTKQLADGTLYAATGLQGGNESFWPIPASSLKMSMLSLAALWRIGESNLPANKKAELQKRLTQNLLDWLYQHRGVVVVIGGIGARGHIHNARRFEVHEFGTNPARSNQGNCVPAAVANAVSALATIDDAKRVEKYFNDHPRVYTTLKQLFEEVHRINLPLAVRRIPKAEREAFQKDPFAWVSNLKSGVWIVRLDQHDKSDHCVAIDGNRGLILDGASRYPFILSEEILRRLGGDHATKLRVAEVRELVMPNVNTKKRSGKKRIHSELD